MAAVPIFTITPRPSSLLQEEFDKYLDQEKETEEEFEAADRTKELYRLSDASGKLSFTLEKTDKVSKSDFDSQVGIKNDDHALIMICTGLCKSYSLCFLLCVQLYLVVLVTLLTAKWELNTLIMR